KRDVDWARRCKKFALITGTDFFTSTDPVRHCRLLIQPIHRPEQTAKLGVVRRERAGMPVCFTSTKTPSSSGRLFRGQFLKAGIVADLIPDRIESQHRRSNRTRIRYLQ